MNAICAARHSETETCGNCCDHGSDYGCTECAAANALKALWTEIDIEKLRAGTWTELDIEKLRDRMCGHTSSLSGSDPGALERSRPARP